MSLLAPIGANALGVGEIELHSALNQVLEAEIPLLTSGSESSSDINVSLASATAFANAGVERPYYLSSLRFTPVMENGRVVVKVSSKDIIREPFLNFLLEVNWPNGRTLREFTVLLDPPVNPDEKAITATQAPGVQSTTVIEPHYPVDRPWNSDFRSKPFTPTQRETVKVYKAGDFVRSKVNDTLWDLAKRVNTDPSISREQMMIALYKANPRVFFETNINALKAGQQIKVPSSEDTSKISRREALSAFRTQNNQWRSLVASPSAEKVPLAVSQANEVSAKTASRSPDRLDLVSAAAGEPVAKALTDSNQSSALGKQETAPEVIDAVRRENAELHSRLKKLEDQLSRLQQLLTLKDEQLGALQSRQTPSENPAEKIIDPAAGKPAMEASKPADQAAVTTKNTVASVEIASQVNVPIAAISEIDSSKPDNLIAPRGREKEQSVITDRDSIVLENAVDKSAAPVQPELTKETPEPVASRPVPAVPSKPEQTAVESPESGDDRLGELLSEPGYLAEGSGAAVLLGILGWVLVRRRDRIGMTDTRSQPASTCIDSEDLNKDTDTETVQTSQNDGVSITEGSFSSEITPGDFGPLETDHAEVDPVYEADVYLAYGRYQKAEDLIRNAIENYPERDECKLKLLEIHFATEDRSAFEAYATGLVAFKNKKPNFWVKVVEMGRELCPDSPLFRPGETADRSGTVDYFAKTEIGDEKPAGFDEEEHFGGFGSDPSGKEDSFAFGDNASAAENLIEFDRFNEDTAFDFSRGSGKRGSEAHRDFGLEGNSKPFQLEDAEIWNSEEPMEEAASDQVSEFSDLTDMDEIETKLDLAKAYFDMGDQESARGILADILIEGNDEQKSEARALVDLLQHKV
ncbi:MAG: FimV/HubP family polar landmark protein [Methylococcales bacterium]